MSSRVVVYPCRVYSYRYFESPGFCLGVKTHLRPKKSFFFLFLEGWDWVSWYCGHYWPIVPAPDDRWWWLWNEDRQGKPKYSEKTCPSATLSTTNPTWLDPSSSPGRRGGKPATNRLSQISFTIRQLCFCLCGPPSLTSGRICHLPLPKSVVQVMYIYVQFYMSTFWTVSLLSRPESESESELLYDWRFTSNQFPLAPRPLRLTTSNISFSTQSFCHSPNVISSLTRGLVCLIQFLLALASIVPRDSWPHFTVSDSRLPQPGGPGPRIYIPQEQDGPVISPGTGFLSVASYDSQGWCSTRHGLHWKHSFQKFYCCMHIRCLRINVYRSVTK
jgi:hypothetical protein